MGTSENLCITSGADAILGEAAKSRCSCLGWDGEEGGGEAGGWSARVSSVCWLRCLCAVLALLGAPWLGRGRRGALE